MPVIERHITQGAHKAATVGTGGYSLFARVIKAPGLITHLQLFTGTAHGQRSVNGRKNIRPQKAAAGRTGSQRIGVDHFFA